MSTATDPTRSSPIAASGHAASPQIAQTLAAPQGQVKVCVKGPGVEAWAQAQAIPWPAKLYDIVGVGQGASFPGHAESWLVRVGNQELVLECSPDEPLLQKWEQALQASPPAVYRIEHQSVSIDLLGQQALAVLAQTSGVRFASEPAGRIVFTRVAGVSCGILVLGEGQNRFYRIWVDYTLASYLWETLVEIVAGM